MEGLKKYSPPRVTTKSDCMSNLLKMFVSITAQDECYETLSNLVSRPGTCPKATRSSWVSSTWRMKGSVLTCPMMGSTPVTWSVLGGKSGSKGYDGSMALKRSRSMKHTVSPGVLEELEAIGNLTLVADKGQAAIEQGLLRSGFFISYFWTIWNSYERIGIRFIWQVLHSEKNLPWRRIRNLSTAAGFLVRSVRSVRGLVLRM